MNVAITVRQDASFYVKIRAIAYAITHVLENVKTNASAPQRAEQLRNHVSDALDPVLPPLQENLLRFQTKILLRRVNKYGHERRLYL